METKPSSFFKNIAWLLEKYREIQKSAYPQEMFRILEITKNKHDECIVKVQVIGKATVFEASPHEIAKNDQFLEGFSKKDIRALTYYATHEIKKPKYRILLQEFREGLNRMIFKLGKRGSATPIEKTAQELSLDKDLIKTLHPEDAHLVGFTAASEHAAAEREEMKKLKKATEFNVRD